jgi:DNA-binding response OmpR family regulator
VIVLSNLGGDTEIKRAMKLGADDYFVKSQHPLEEVMQKQKTHSREYENKQAPSSCFGPFTKH